MTRERRSSRSWCVFGALAFPLGALAQDVRRGSEFQVNTYTTGSQGRAAVAANDDGDFVVAWSSNGQDGSNDGVFARRFTGAGAPLATEFQVNTYTTAGQREPSVALDAGGGFVVAWDSNGQDGSSFGVFAQRFSSAGTPLASEFQVNTYTTGFQGVPSVAADADGNFVVAWHSNGQDGYTYGVFARRFSSAGAPVGSEFQVNTYTERDQELPSVAISANGDFVVAWTSYGQDSEYSDGIFARRFSSAGAPVGSEFQVNTYTDYRQWTPSVAANADGDFVVAWTSDRQDGSLFGVFARRFSSAGAPLTGELQVNTFTDYDQGLPSVAASADGDFVVVWSSSIQDGSSDGVFARRVSSTGVLQASEFQVNTYTPNQQFVRGVAADADGDFVVVWESSTQDGSLHGVFAQRFGPPITLDIDGDGSVQALTDGLLVLRRFFGLSGVPLTSGVIGTGCTRCDAAAIEPYLAALGLVLDIDGNGSTQALADGLLTVRYLFGLRGAALTSGAIGTGCTRCDAAAIEPHLAGLVN